MMLGLLARANADSPNIKAQLPRSMRLTPFWLQRCSLLTGIGPIASLRKGQDPRINPARIARNGSDDLMGKRALFQTPSDRRGASFARCRRSDSRRVQSRRVPGKMAVSPGQLSLVLELAPAGNRQAAQQTPDRPRKSKLPPPSISFTANSHRGSAARIHRKLRPGSVPLSELSRTERELQLSLRAHGRLGMRFAVPLRSGRLQTDQRSSIPPARLAGL